MKKKLSEFARECAESLDRRKELKKRLNCFNLSSGA